MKTTDTTELSNMRVETESHIRTLERGLDSLDANIDIDPVVKLVRRRRLVQIIEDNQAYVAELDGQIELAAVNNINAAHRYDQMLAEGIPSDHIFKKN